MSLTLYQLDAALAEIEDALIASGGEIDEATDARLDDLLDARDDKVDRYIALIRTYETTASAFKEEEQRIAQNRKAAENAAKRLKERLLLSMQQRGEAELKGRLGKAKVQRAGTAPVRLLVDVERLPEAFVRRKVEADLSALRTALKAGDETAAEVAELEPASEYVRIY